MDEAYPEVGISQIELLSKLHYMQEIFSFSGIILISISGSANNVVSVRINAMRCLPVYILSKLVNQDPRNLFQLIGLPKHNILLDIIRCFLIMLMISVVNCIYYIYFVIL